MSMLHESNRALVVDDSVVVRRVAGRMLANAGFEIFEAENGEAALEALPAVKPNLVLLDWNMPGISGLDVMKYISAMVAPDRPKVIFCTTEAAYARITEAMNAGADEYIMKPFDEEILRIKLTAIGALRDPLETSDPVGQA